MTLRYLITIFCVFIPLTTCAMEDYRDVERYLNSITTFQAEFKQIGEDGIERSGNFYLSKPGQIRWEYLKPKRVVLVGNGSRLVYYDYELEEITYLSSTSTLANFLSKEKINFTQDLIVEDYIKGTHYSEITVSSKDTTEESNISKLILKFEHNPMRLIEINIIDNNGQLTEIIFKNTEININIDKSVFVFKNPKFFKNLR